MKLRNILLLVFGLSLSTLIYADDYSETEIFVELIHHINDPLKLKTLSLSLNSDFQLASVQQIRKLVSINNDTSKYDEIIESGIVPVLVKLLKSNNSDVIYEAVWTITNLASGTSEQTQSVVESDAIPSLIDLLEYNNTAIKNQAIWALSNIIGDENPDYRDYCIELGILPKLMKFIDANYSMSFLRDVAWTMVNLCRPKNPRISIQNVQTLLPGFKKLLNHHDATIVSDSLWGLAYITQTNTTNVEKENIQVILNDEIIVKRVIKLLTHPDVKIKSPSIRIIGNIVSGTDKQTQKMLDYGILTDIKEMLNFWNSDQIMKDIFWTLSNILAGPIEQANAVFDADIFSNILEYSDTEDIKIKNELIWCIRNAARYNEILKTMMEMGVIKSLCEMLKDIDGVDDDEVKGSRDAGVSEM
uniref:Importin subunit alpha n=1 Tax=Panagrolaimus sp. ES5 TaxID=591445 RepID=A0AC34F0D7_9BILA